MSTGHVWDMCRPYTGETVIVTLRVAILPPVNKEHGQLLLHVLGPGVSDYLHSVESGSLLMKQ